MNTICKKIKQKLNRSSLLILLLFILIMSTSCKKYLDRKPAKEQVIPSTLNDMQTLLDNEFAVMNVNNAASFSEFAADNYYVTTKDWQSWLRLPYMTGNYIWDGNADPYSDYWNLPYQNPIYYSNIVLDQLPLVTTNSGEEAKYNALKGSALFYRAFSFQQLAQLFCKPYSTENANDLGIVLKVTSNVSEHITRATVQQTYDRIIADMKEAADLLPLTTLFRTRPSKVAAYAALARTYLSMRDYINAGSYANLALQQYNTLMDYNTLAPIGTVAMTIFNPEVIFHDNSPDAILLTNDYHKIDSMLYQSYDANDLRKTIFFQANTGPAIGTFYFKGSYNGISKSRVFDGLTTDELYLIRAECYARTNNKDAALADLNSLMVKRWRAGLFTTITAIDAADALNKILTERRKELVFRGLRWSDIRRFNVEGANITLKRIIAGTTYTLPPNDLRSVMLIPLNEIKYSGVEQNPR